LYEFGIQLGLAFQLQDDLLDTFGDQDTFGKKIGGDILANKKTYLLIKALENAGDELNVVLLAWIGREDFDPQQKIQAVTQIYKEVGVKELAEKMVDSYFVQAMEILEKLKVSDKRKTALRELSKKMLTRKK